jgi:ribosomal-protein-alanine N-acetyltransferase
MFRDVYIETERLFLRPFTVGDYETFESIASQSEVLRFLPDDDRMTPEQLKAVLDWLIRCYDENTPARIHKFTLPILLKDTGGIVGWCGLGPLEFDESETEIYFILSKHHWGRGIATEAARALLDYAFCSIGLKRIVAVVDPRNVASVRVIEKLGMTREGVLTAPRARERGYGRHVLYSIGRNASARY